jgi:hypothetical protein
MYVSSETFAIVLPSHFVPLTLALALDPLQRDVLSDCASVISSRYTLTIRQRILLMPCRPHSREVTLTNALVMIEHFVSPLRIEWACGIVNVIAIPFVFLTAALRAMIAAHSMRTAMAMRRSMSAAIAIVHTTAASFARFAGTFICRIPFRIENLGGITVESNAPLIGGVVIVSHYIGHCRPLSVSIYIRCCNSLVRNRTSL